MADEPFNASLEDSSGKVKDFDKPFEVLRWVTRCADWPTREKMAYIALYLRRSENSQHPHPGIRLLAKDIGSTKDAAQAAVAALTQIGALTYNLRGGPKGQNLYTLRPPWEAEQTITRKKRGPLRKCPVIQDASRKTGQAVSRKTGQVVSAITGQKEPRQGAKTRSQGNTSSPTAQTAMVMPSNSLSSKGKTVEPKDTQLLAERLDSLLTESSYPRIEDWGAARKIAANVLKGGGGSPPLPVEEALLALEWGFSDNYQRGYLLSNGLKALRRVWAAWRDRDKASPKGGRGTYRPVANDGPEFDENGPWGRG